MTNLMQYVDVCIGNEEDADPFSASSPARRTLPAANWSLQAIKISSNRWLKVPQLQVLRILSPRKPFRIGQRLVGFAFTVQKIREFYHSKTYTLHPIVDRVGGGFAVHLVPQK